MPPRKEMTRRSPRASKLKEAYIGEGSFLDTTRKLEFSPRADPIIKTLTKKEFYEPHDFSDTKATIGSNMMLPQW
jgi:hypothetical protein